MHRELLAIELERCRKLIPEFVGCPEEPLLLGLASAFEQLALGSAAINDTGNCEPPEGCRGR